MDEESKHLQHQISFTIQVENQHLQLQPFVALAKHITDSPVCEINIMDADYLRILAHNEAEPTVIPRIDSVCNDTIRKDGGYEIENLKENRHYKNLSYVKGDPFFRYYFGVKLTTSKGKNIGTICVMDTKSKRISDEQKVQFELLAHMVATAIERESTYNNISHKLNGLRDNLRKLNHDIRTPINGIIGMADLLIEDQEQIKDLTHDIKMIKTSAETMIDIINGALVSNDMNNNNNVQLPDKYPLSKVLEKLNSLYNPPAQNNNLSLTLTNHMGNGIQVPYYFSIKLLQAIGNLVSNAITFTPENGSVDVIFSGGSERNQTTLNITVKDTGKGMSSDQVSAFNNGKPVARSAVSSGEERFGIGLQHVLQIISEEGGTISVEAQKGLGTRFSISLPLPADKMNKKKKSVPVDSKSFIKPMVNGNN